MQQHWWSSTVKHQNHIQLLSWNAGNLQRNANKDTVNDLLCSPYHIACVQEAAVSASQVPLFEARGIARLTSRDRCSMVCVGGAGHKRIRKVHDDSNPFCDWVPRPHYLEPSQITPIEFDEKETKNLKERSC